MESLCGRSRGGGDEGLVVICITYRNHHVQESCTLELENFVTETTYTSLRQSLASVLDRVANDHEVVIVRRRGEKNVAMVPADELAGLMETAHLLRSPKNAQRLLTALRRATTKKGTPKSLEQFQREMGLGPEEREARIGSKARVRGKGRARVTA